MGLLLMCSTGISEVFASPVYTNDFESGSLGAIQHAQVKGTQGYKDHGFGSYYAWSNSNESNPMTLQLEEIPEHSYLKIEFDLAVIDSWDGDTNVYRWTYPDYFNVKVDGTSVFNKSFNNFDRSKQSYEGEPIVWGEQLNNSRDDWKDSAYHISLEIPHTSNTATITWFASGDGWQGGGDESYAIDNIKVFAAVPIPASAWILGSGLLGLLAIRRKIVD